MQMKFHVIQNEKFNKIHSTHSIGFILRTLSAKELCTAWRCADLTFLII